MAPDNASVPLNVQYLTIGGVTPILTAPLLAFLTPQNVFLPPPYLYPFPGPLNASNG